MVRSGLYGVLALSVAVGVLVGCGSSLEDPDGPPADDSAEVEAPNVSSKAYSIDVKVDCTSLSKGGSCGSYNGVQYCNWCPDDRCSQSNCECLPNSSGSGCNGAASRPTR